MSGTLTNPGEVAANKPNTNPCLCGADFLTRGDRPVNTLIGECVCARVHIYKHICILCV